METPEYLDTPDRRYRRDPTFRALVHMLLVELERCNFTPSELREAIILACTMREAWCERLRETDVARIKRHALADPNLPKPG